MSDVIASAARQLSVASAEKVEADSAMGEVVREIFQEKVWPHYTMVSERAIHLDFMIEVGLEAGDVGETEEKGTGAVELDDLIF